MSDAEKTTVLVADDEKRYAEAHARMLDDEYSVETAHGGQAALDTVSADVDVLVLDRNMPTLSGDEVAAQVCESDYECRIVMITAVEPDLDIVDLGIDDYLTKPVSEEELKETLENVLEWADYDDTLQDYFALSNKREVLLEEGSGIEETERFSEIEERLMEAAERGLQKSEEVLQTLIQSSPAAIVTLDEAGKIDIWNPSAEELFGWSYEEVSGSDPPMFSTDAQERMEDIRADLFTDGTVTDFDIECVTASGTHRDISLSAAPLYDSTGEMYGTMFVMTDITARKQREQRLSVMSRVLRHNMRNELNVVLGHAEVAKNSLPEEEHEHIDVVVETVNELLDLSQKAQTFQEILDDDGNDFAERDLAVIFEHAIAQAESEFSDVDIEAAIEAGETTVICGRGLSNAVWQLLENAIEHADSEAIVELSLSEESGATDDWIVVEVADNGPGIPTSEIEVLGRDEENALRHGSGLGLWTVKWIVDRNGGDLSFEQSHMGGALVRMRLPHRLRD